MIERGGAVKLFVIQNEFVMKPKDLLRPYRWQDRKVLLKDGVFYVPDFLPNYEDSHLARWEDPALFGNKNPVHIEYCSGNGRWIIERALSYPDINWIAVERRFDRVRKIWSKVQNEGIKNLFIICGEALIATQYYIAKESISAIYINFPDPWPKERHAKHRLVQKPFTAELARILKIEGSLTLVTDHIPYSEQMIAELQPLSSLSPLFPHPYYTKEMKGYGSSWFEDLWREKGAEIRYQKYRKISLKEEGLV